MALDALLPVSVVVLAAERSVERAKLLELPVGQLRTLLTRARTLEAPAERAQLMHYADCARDDGSAALMPRASLARRQRRRSDDDDDANPLDIALAALRSSRSTRFSVTGPPPPVDFFVALDDEYAPARDYALECELARLVRVAPPTLLTCGAGADYFPALSARFVGRFAVFVASSPRVAARFRAQARGCCVSVNELLGELPPRASPRLLRGSAAALVFIDAHALGVDTLVRALHALTPTLDVLPAPLWLAGDALEVSGSVHVGDRGAPFRDLVALARRGALDGVTLDAVLPFETVGRLGPLDDDAHCALRNGTLCADSAAALECVGSAAAASGADLPVAVACSSALAAFECARRAGVSLAKPFNVDTWLLVDGYELVRVVERRHWLGAERLSAALPWLRIDDRLGVVVGDSSRPSFIDHRVCCRLGTPHTLLLAAHYVRSADVLPVRTLARALAYTPHTDSLTLLVDAERASLDDIRAALSLVRRSVRVHADAPTLAAALARRGSRPRTSLVDIVNGGGIAPSSQPPLDYRSVDVETLPATVAPTAFSFVGSTRAAHCKRVGDAHLGDGRLIVAVESLREHELARLGIVAAAANQETLVERFARTPSATLCERVTTHLDALTGETLLPPPFDELTLHMIGVAAKASGVAVARLVDAEVALARRHGIRFNETAFLRTIERAPAPQPRQVHGDDDDDNESLDTQPPLQRFMKTVAERLTTALHEPL